MLTVTSDTILDYSHNFLDKLSIGKMMYLKYGKRADFSASAGSDCKDEEILKNMEIEKMKSHLGFTLVYNRFVNKYTHLKVYINKENGEVHVVESHPFAIKNFYTDFTVYYKFLNGKWSCLSRNIDGIEFYSCANDITSDIKVILHDLKLLK
jgi:hypothetical protein